MTRRDNDWDHAWPPGMGQSITDDDLDAIRNVCRCGTYPRIRQAIVAGPEKM